MANFIRFNLFPLSIQVRNENGDVVVDELKSRTVVTDDEVIVYVDSPEGPRPVYQERIDDFYGEAKLGWTVEISNGDVMSIRRNTGCGCGSRLRGFNPFPGVPFQAAF